MDIISLFVSIFSTIKEIVLFLLSIISKTIIWFNETLPTKKVLGQLANNKILLNIFIRDFFIINGTPLYSREGLNGQIGVVPNVTQLWPDVECRSLAKLLNLLGLSGKRNKIEIIEMGNDSGIWNTNLIILGAQTQKCFDFYSRMQEVAFRVTNQDIIDNRTGRRINRDPNYGYGIILKCKNPYVANDKGVGFLLGGYGTLGTEAATYYFVNHISELGKKFNNKSFGVVIRASVSAGIQSTERLLRYDRSF